MVARNVVLTHRYGDIITVLPILKHWHDEGHHVRFVVHAEFADLFRAISYVDEVSVWDGDMNDTEDACRRVASLKWDGETFCPVRAWHNRERRCEHFNTEFWHDLGALSLYHQLSLIVDNRSPEREEALRARHLPKGTDKPILSFNFASRSFRFGAAAAMERWLIETNDRFGKPYTLINLSAHRAECIFDVLGLLDQSKVMLTVDTATIHLAQAANVPSVVIVPDEYHNSPEPRHHWIASFKASEVARRDGLRQIQWWLFEAGDSLRATAQGRLTRPVAAMTKTLEAA